MAGEVKGADEGDEEGAVGGVGDMALTAEEEATCSTLTVRKLSTREEVGVEAQEEEEGGIAGVEAADPIVSGGRRGQQTAEIWKICQN